MRHLMIVILLAGGLASLPSTPAAAAPCGNLPCTIRNPFHYAVITVYARHKGTVPVVSIYDQNKRQPNTFIGPFVGTATFQSVTDRVYSVGYRYRFDGPSLIAGHLVSRFGRSQRQGHRQLLTLWDRRPRTVELDTHPTTRR